MKRNLSLARVFAVALGCSAGVGAAADRDIWILIDTRHQTLSLMKDESPLHVYGDIAIGENGASGKKAVGDKKTPTGLYRVTEVRSGTQTRFHRFIGIDYPRLEDARRALDAGTITDADYAAILHAHEQGRAPPSDTPLGGLIGIHGLGTADPRVHQAFNWTEGCVAITNEQIDELVPWVFRGMSVVIQ